ncbi:MAG: hypothetical protein KAH05_08350 [Clostridiales bacterium]|nr:hypothetical protein [Clostridiales bacterium]
MELPEYKVPSIKHATLQLYNQAKPFVVKASTIAVLLLSADAVLHASTDPLSMFFTPVTAFAFVVFNLFTPSCFAAIGAMNAELRSKNGSLRL